MARNFFGPRLKFDLFSDFFFVKKKKKKKNKREKKRVFLFVPTEMVSSRYLRRLVPAPCVLSKKLHIATPAHFHKGLRLPLASRSCFFPFDSPITVGHRYRDSVVGKTVLAFGVLFKHFDRYIVILVFDDFADLDVVDGAEERTFAADFALREVELVHGARQTVGAVGEFELAVRDPGMLEAFVDRDPLLDVDGQHAVDEVEGWVTDRIPVRGWVVEAACFDLL